MKSNMNYYNAAATDREETAVTPGQYHAPDTTFSTLQSTSGSNFFDGLDFPVEELRAEPTQAGNPSLMRDLYNLESLINAGCGDDDEGDLFEPNAMNSSTQSTLSFVSVTDEQPSTETPIGELSAP